MYRNAMDTAMQPQRADAPWKMYTDSFHDSLANLEDLINQIDEMQDACTNEWCGVTACLLDEVTVSAFAISEPHWSAEADSKKLKKLKARLHELHLKYKEPTVH